MAATRAKTPAASPAKAPASKAPSLDSLQGQLCPRCRVGVLQVTVYDPDASHELDNPVRAGRSLSGGAYQVTCHHCDFAESRAMNPSEVRAGTVTRGEFD